MNIIKKFDITIIIMKILHQNIKNTIMHKERKGHKVKEQLKNQSALLIVIDKTCGQKVI